MIGFDLDGIFLPDINFPDDQHTANIDRILDFRTRMIRTIFKPDFDFVVITGRPMHDRGQTKFWLRQNMRDNMPKNILHFNPEMERADVYKAEVLNDNPEIDVYFESCEGQVEYLRRNVHTGCHVVHFETFLNMAIIQRVNTIRIVRGEK